jgi:hypothetical protein
VLMKLRAHIYINKLSLINSYNEAISKSY